MYASGVSTESPKTSRRCRRCSRTSSHRTHARGLSSTARPRLEDQPRIRQGKGRGPLPEEEDGRHKPQLQTAEPGPSEDHGRRGHGQVQEAREGREQPDERSTAPTRLARRFQVACTKAASRINPNARRLIRLREWPFGGPA